VRLPERGPELGDGLMDTRVRYIDSFGNLRLAARASDLASAFGPMPDGSELWVEIGQSAGPAERVPYTRTFGQVPAGAALLYVDSSGDVALADNQGNAAARLGATVGQPIRITRA
jgi:S-adenosylmethionine hydrolase